MKVLTCMFRWKNVAIRDRHAPRHNAYRQNGMKKDGAGVANWGRDTEYDGDIPLHVPFDDPAVDHRQNDYSKVRVCLHL